MTEEQNKPEETIDENTEELTGFTVNEEQIENLKQHQNFSFALIGGLLTAFLCAVLWAVITVATKYQIGYMAIAVGLLVGLSVRYFGLGIDRKFGILGACLAFIGCIFGNLFSQVGFIANEHSYSYVELLSMLDFDLSLELLSDSFHPMDILFYGFAIYEGYRFSFRRITPKILASGGGVENQKFRITLVIAAIIVLTVTFVKIRQGYSGVKTYTYETGEKMSEGEIKKGKYQGAWTFYHKNGKLLSKGNFYNDLRDGDWEWYSDDGLLEQTGSYLKGSEHGTWKYYHKNNAVLDSLEYVYGRANGKYIAMFEDGSIQQTGFYKDGLKDGFWFTYYENGGVYSRGSFKKGNMFDRWITYLDDGTLLEEVMYDSEGNAKFTNLNTKNGESLIKDGNGTYKLFSEDNKTLLLSGEYKNGEKTGVWKTYYANGDLKEEGSYENSIYKRHNAWNLNGEQTIKEGTGKYISYYEDGVIYETGEVINGFNSGKFTSFYPDGTTAVEVNYTNGILNGETNNYLKSGHLSLTGKYLNNKKEGEWIWYNSNGTISSTATFKNDLKDGIQIINDDNGLFIRKETYKNGEIIDVELTQ